MLKENDKIKIHLYSTNHKEIKTRNYEKVFTVSEKGGKLGIDWAGFTPFEDFASSVIFEDVESGKKFHLNFKDEIVEIK